MSRDDGDVSRLQALGRLDNQRGANLRQFTNRRWEEVFVVALPESVDFLRWTLSLKLSDLDEVRVYSPSTSVSFSLFGAETL